MPALGRRAHLWIRGIFPVSVSLDQNSEQARLARAIMRKYPEVESVVVPTGASRRGTDPDRLLQRRILRAPQAADRVAAASRSRRLVGLAGLRLATKAELVADMSAELNEAVPGVNWNFSQIIRDNVMEVLSGVQGRELGQDHRPRPRRAGEIGNQVVTGAGRRAGDRKTSASIAFRGSRNLELPVDRQKCSLWSVSVADVHNVIQTAIGGKTVSQMIEGEKSFDITIRWPLSAARRRKRHPRTSRSTSPTTRSPKEHKVATLCVHQCRACRSASPRRAPASRHHPSRGSSSRFHVARSYDHTRASAWATWSRRWAETATTASIRMDNSFAPGASTIYRETGQSHDRRQVQRPRPRPGQRRGRGSGQGRTHDPQRLPHRMER